MEPSLTTPQIRRGRSLSAKLGLVVLGLFLATAALVVVDHELLDDIRGSSVKQQQMGLGPTMGYRVLADGRRLADETGERRAQIASELRAAMESNARRYRALLDGDPEHDIPAVEHAVVRAGLERRAAEWRTEIMPQVERAIAAPDPAQTLAAIEVIVPRLRAYAEQALVAADQEQALLDDAASRAETIQLVFAALVLAAVGIVFWMSRGIGRRAAVLARAASRVAGGELAVTTDVRGGDELAVLGDTFNTMTANLRRLIETERNARERVEGLLRAILDTANRLASSTSEILAGTTQQASAATEQAAAVAQTVATVEEVAQTSEQAAQRARAVADASQRSTEIGKAGRKAVDDAVESMATVRDRTASISETVLALAEQGQSIGEIIAVVNEIAEQTNLLALNAGIEAARAGEHGRGFSVVAAEVKALAEQSKKATAQVRQILGEVQKATSRAVMTAEDGARSVASAIRVTTEAGDTIRQLGQVIDEAAQAGSQIAASAGQQAVGMRQIHQAMQSINQATNETLAATKQSERAAHDLGALGAELKTLLA